MGRTVTFYKTAAGKCPIQDFLDSLPGKVAQKVIWVLRLLEDLDAVLSSLRSLREIIYFSQRTQSFKIWEEGQNISDLKKYIRERKRRDKEFAEGFEEGYKQFKVGVMLRQVRESAGLTQEELARRLKTRKTAISRIENHAEDIKLSTLERVAVALGKRLQVSITWCGRNKFSVSMWFF